jgi:hypothetical protein
MAPPSMKHAIVSAVGAPNPKGTSESPQPSTMTIERYGAEKRGADHVVGEQQSPGGRLAKKATEQERADHARQRVRGHRATDP